MSDQLTLGLLAAELEESHRPKLFQVMERFGHLKEYWILVTCFWIGKSLHRRFLVFGKLPVIKKYVNGKLVMIPFQATMCYYRNNTWPDDKQIKRIWVLTHDFPIPDEFFRNGEASSPHPADDAWRLGVPMIY